MFQVALIDPGSYRQTETIVQAETRGRGTLEVLDLKDVDESDDFYAAKQPAKTLAPAASATSSVADASEGLSKKLSAASVAEG